jgi:cation:H+ antiporter
VIFITGKQLSILGDRITELTSIGKAWFGIILMAAVTSLPELMVGVSSSAIVASADLAVGDIIGSCAINLAILSLLDVFMPKDHPLLSYGSRSNVLATIFGIALMAMAGLGIFLGEDIVVLPSIGLTSISFAIIYLFSVKTLYSFEKKNNVGNEIKRPEHKEGLSRTIIKFIFFALIIVAAAIALPYFAETIADETGLSKSFVGSLFLAVSTSLPEIAVSIAAVRIGSVELAIGNLIGSNIFNVFILFIDDIFYTEGLVLKDASEIHLVSVFFVIMMASVAIIGFLFPQSSKRVLLAWDTLVILLLYILNVSLLFELS